MKSRALLDTGFLIAVLNADDEHHDTCVTAFLKETPKPLLPDMVVPELAYMILRERSYPILIDFLHTLVAGELNIERTSPEDLARAAELLEKYADSRIDFVDCIITAMAERLKIRRILTVDRRDFQLLRPKHCAYFEIVP
jgi:hypothetical protein